ncbi:MAG: polysaccharide deacetylase family protein [Flavobacterium sp.]|nr:polysaccharide deacetylase family protein [Flavobacterium sp.]
MKKIFLIWDFDGPIGQINSTLPYNFHFENMVSEIDHVKWLLEIMDEYAIHSCFAITGFSAEQGIYPYTFPDLIKEIASRGHEVASHSWKHEWIPKFSKNQIEKSIRRSKKALEEAIGIPNIVSGFVPPHNRPMTWWQRGAFSWGDQWMFPFSKLGNTEELIALLNKNDFSWIRVSYKNILQRFKIVKRNPTGTVFNYKGMLVFENHYNGFDSKVIDHILKTNYETYTISAHPFMLGLSNKSESKANFILFLNKLLNSGQNIEFVLPSSLLKEHKNNVLSKKK